MQVFPICTTKLHMGYTDYCDMAYYMGSNDKVIYSAYNYPNSDPNHIIKNAFESQDDLI